MDPMDRNGGKRRKRGLYKGRGRGGGRGDGNRGREALGKGGDHTESDMALLQSLGFDWQAFAAARAAGSKQTQMEIPTDGFNQPNPPINDPAVNKGVQDEGTGSNPEPKPERDNETKEEPPHKEMPESDPAPEEYDGRAVKNYYGQVWKKTTEPTLAVRLAFHEALKKIELEHKVVLQDFEIPSDSASDKVGGISLAISIAILVAYHQADIIEEKIDPDKLFRYLSWFQMEKLLQLINDYAESDKVVKAISKHKGGAEPFDPRKVNISKLKALHGSTLHKTIEDERSDPKDSTLTAAIRNTLERMYPRDVNEMMKQAEKMQKWEKAHLVYKDGVLHHWVESNCPKGTEHTPLSRYDLSLFSGFSEEALESVTDGRYEMVGREIEKERGTPPSQVVDSGVTQSDILGEMGIDRVHFEGLDLKGKRDMLMKEIPAYVLREHPTSMAALAQLPSMSDSEIVALIAPSKLQGVLNVSGPNQSNQASPYSKSSFKYGKDDHGSNEITTYLIQLRSTTKTGTISGTAAEKFGPFVRFTHGLLTSIGHKCQFIQWNSSTGAPPIDRSEDLPVGAELEKYIGHTVTSNKQSNKFRSFFFKVRTSYPSFQQLAEQAVEVNQRFEKPFDMFLQAADLTFEVFQSSIGPRPRFLIRESTRNWDPEEVKVELLRRAAAKGKEISPELFSVSWATCKTTQGPLILTGGLCIFCSIEDDEVVEDATAKLPYTTIIEFPVTAQATFVEAAYTKSTKANVNQYYNQLKYHDDYVKGVVHLTVSGLPEEMYPFTYVPTDTSPVKLGSDVAHKVVKHTLSIGKLLMLHNFDLMEEVAKSPIRAIHRDRATGKWLLEASSKQAGMLGILAGDIGHLIIQLTGKQVTLTQEGMTSHSDIKLEALRRRLAIQEKNKPSGETVASTALETSASQATEAPTKPPQPLTKPTTIPPTPAKQAVTDGVLQEIVSTLNGLSKLADAVNNQASQMEEIRKEIGEIKTTMKNQKPVEEVVVEDLTHKISELTETAAMLKKDVVSVEMTTEQLKQVLGKPSDNIDDQPDVYTSVRHIIKSVDSLQIDLEDSLKKQEFLVRQSLSLERDLKALQEETLQEEESGEEQVEKKHESKDVAAEVRTAMKPMLEHLAKIIRSVPTEIVRTFDAQLNTSILRCLIGQGNLRLLLYETMDPADREEKDKIFQGHTHKQLPALTSMSFDEVVRLLHKSPNVASRLEVEHNKGCVKCEEVSVPGQMSDCTFCNSAFHKLCHEPAFFLRRGDKDHHMCRLCRDDLHLERLIEEIRQCSSCMKYVSAKKEQIEERAAISDSKSRQEKEKLIRDAVAGNDMWHALRTDIENNLMFLMQRIAPDEDPEDQPDNQNIQIVDLTNDKQLDQTAPPQTDSYRVETLLEKQPEGQSADEVKPSVVDPPTGLTPPKPTPAEEKERKREDPPSNSTSTLSPPKEIVASKSERSESVGSENSDPKTPPSKFTVVEEAKGKEQEPESKSTEDEDASGAKSVESNDSTEDDSDEDDSVVAREKTKSGKTLRPTLAVAYALRSKGELKDKTTDTTLGNKRGGGSVKGDDSDSDSESSII